MVENRWNAVLNRVQTRGTGSGIDWRALHPISSSRLKQRVIEHKCRVVQADFNSSALAEHARTLEHAVDWKNVNPSQSPLTSPGWTSPTTFPSPITPINPWPHPLVHPLFNTAFHLFLPYCTEDGNWIATKMYAAIKYVIERIFANMRTAVQETANILQMYMLIVVDQAWAYNKLQHKSISFSSGLRSSKEIFLVSQFMGYWKEHKVHSGFLNIRYHTH